MKITSRDYKFLKVLRIREISAYLKAHNWIKSKLRMPKNIIWELKKESKEKIYLTIPSKTTFVDYEDRLVEAIEKLERVEERPQDIILKDIMSTGSDVIRIKPEKYESNYETLPFEEGVALFENAKKLVYAAACSTVHPTRKITKPATKVKAYMKKVRLGQTERGSYVLTIFSPVQPPTTLPEMQQETFERKVTKTLLRAIDATRNAAIYSAKTGKLKQFEDSVKVGVSAELCEALSELQERTNAKSIAINISWSPFQSIPEGYKSSVEISQQYIPEIKKAIDMFREVKFEPIPKYKLKGFVTNLHREDPTAEKGTVTIKHGVPGGGERHVKVILDDHAHQHAIEAYKYGYIVSCWGKLDKEGRTFKLYNPTSFEVDVDNDFKNQDKQSKLDFKSPSS